MVKTCISFSRVSAKQIAEKINGINAGENQAVFATQPMGEYNTTTSDASEKLYDVLIHYEVFGNALAYANNKAEAPATTKKKIEISL